MIDIKKVVALSYEGEEWKQIPDFPNYLISNFGRLYGGRFNRINNGEVNKKGYRIYELYSDAFPNGKKLRACRLVAEAFCKGYAPDMEVHHCNFNKLDDNACNLMWVTHEQHVAIQATKYKRSHKIECFSLNDIRKYTKAIRSSAENSAQTTK